MIIIRKRNTGYAYYLTLTIEEWIDDFKKFTSKAHTTAFLEEKMNYIHNNLVKAELVGRPEDYLYSPARDYAGEKGLVEIVLVLNGSQISTIRSDQHGSISGGARLPADKMSKPVNR